MWLDTQSLSELFFNTVLHVSNAAVFILTGISALCDVSSGYSGAKGRWALYYESGKISRMRKGLVVATTGLFIYKFNSAE